MSGRDGSEVEVRRYRGYTLRGRHVEYVLPALSRHSGDLAPAATRFPGDSATGKANCNGVGVVPESPAHDDVINHALAKLSM